MAAVALTAQMSEVMSGLTLRFLSAEADKEYTRSKCLRNMNFQTVVLVIAPIPSCGLEGQ
jgi:hypothetical protein